MIISLETKHMLNETDIGENTLCEVTTAGSDQPRLYQKEDCL